jgi:dihydrofolate reductase
VEVAKVFADIDISLDGFVAGADISPDNPLGAGGEALIWYGDDVNDHDADFEGAYGEVDARVLRDAGKSEGAVIMGRRTFEVSIGAWGENPPIHKPCFVLSSQAAPTVIKPGGTSFVFVTEGPEEAVRLAKEAAGGLDVGVMGGARTIRGFLAHGLLDELRLHVVPVLLGKGLRLFEDESAAQVELEKVEALDGERAVHMVLRPRPNLTRRTGVA